MSCLTACGWFISHCLLWLFLCLPGFSLSLFVYLLCALKLFSLLTPSRPYFPCQKRLKSLARNSTWLMFTLHFSHSHSQQEDLSPSPLRSLNPVSLRSPAVSKLISPHNLFMFSLWDENGFCIFKDSLQKQIIIWNRETVVRKTENADQLACYRKSLSILFWNPVHQLSLLPSMHITQQISVKPLVCAGCYSKDCNWPFVREKSQVSTFWQW